ncbi:MAG: RHS repeat protein [Rubrivivax sp.]|nr:MAG: RHS repeat protein [Rubrivivax sp.]
MPQAFRTTLCAALLAGASLLAAPAAQSGSLFGGGSTCDPTKASCIPPPGGGGGSPFPFPPPGGGGGGGGGVCTAPPGGSPSCGGAGPASVGGGGAGGLMVGGGNPINLITGNKYQEETDLAALPGMLGLELKRYYNSLSPNAGIAGAQWRLSYETVLVDLGSQIQILQADGRRITLTKGQGQQGGGTLCTSPQLSDGQVRIEQQGGQPVYHWRWADGRVLTFMAVTAAPGRGFPLHSITAATGERVQLGYNPMGDLISVVDPQGRKLTLGYGRAGAGQRALLRSVESPLGQIRYKQDEQGRLTEVTFGDTLTRRYHYEAEHNGGNEFALTGISAISRDAKGQLATQRLSTYAYDKAGLAVLSTKGRPLALKDGKPLDGTGIEQIKVQYLAKPSPQEGTPDKTGEVQVKSERLGRVVVTNSLGQTTELTTAVIGGGYRLVSMRGPGCSTCGPSNRSHGYDREGRLLRTTELDANGRPVASELRRYDDRGRLARVERQAYVDGKPQPAQLLQRFEYAEVKFKDGSIAVGTQPSLVAQPSVIAGKERTTAFDYNEFGQVVKVTQAGWSPVDAKGEPVAQGVSITRTTTYNYKTVNGRSLLAQVDGPLANGPKGTPEDSDVTLVQWDERGNQPVKLLHPAGLVTRADYTADGRTRQLIGMDGVASVFDYAPDGSLASITRAGATRRFEHDALGQTTSVLEASGARTRVAFDLAGQVAALFDAQNNRVELQRDREGRLLQARLLNPDGSVSQQRDFPAQSEADGSAAGRDGVMTAMRDIVSQAQDAGNVARPDLLQAMRAAQDALSDGWPRPSQSITDIADASGAYTSHYRDDFGQLRRVESPTTGTSLFEYDAAGRLLARVQVELSRAEYRRDPAGRVIAVHVRDVHGQVDEDARITWGPANKPQLIKYLAGEERFAYDAGGRLAEHEQRVDRQRWTIKYAHNAAGQLIGKTLPDGRQLDFRYRGSQHSRAGLLESVWLDGRVARPLVYGLNDEADTYTSRRFLFGNGLSNERRLDAQGRVVAAGTPDVALSQLGYAGTQPQDVDPATAKTLRTLGLGQAAGSTASPLWQARLHAQIDRWRAPDAVPQPGLPATTGTGPAAQELFDDLGRQITRGDLRLSYDSLNRLVEVQRDTGAAALQPVARYRYNLFGQRIAKVTAQAGSQAARTTYFFHDGSQLVAEADATGTVQRQYVWINDKPVALLTQQQVLHVHTDHRDAPVALTDASRRVVWQAEVADYLAASPAQGASLGNVEFNLRGSNQYHDPETGLHYNTHRYYDAQAGRYLSPDPLGLSVGPDLYAFALNRPHSMQDPLGLAPITTDKDVPNADFADKVKYVFEKAAEKYPGEVGNALLEMVSPTALATTAGIFAVWAVAQATPVGWAADLLLAGVGYFLLGSAIVDTLDTLVQTSIKVYKAKCLSDLDAAADVLAKGLGSATVNIGSGAAAAGAPKLAKLLKQLLKKRPAGKVPNPPAATKPPPVPPPVSLNSLKGKQLFGPKLSNIATRNDGKLGEQLAAQVLEALTGGKYRGIHNGSGNGPDLIRINPATKTIEHVEVKSSQTGKPGWPTGNPTTRFNDWINEASQLGTISGKAISAADRKYAQDIYDLLNKGGYKLENKVMQVSIPAPKTTGTPILELFDWI